MSDPSFIHRSDVNRQLGQSKLSIYTVATCSFCQRAKDLLDKAGIKYEEHALQREDAEKIRWVIQQSGGRKVFPQLFVDEDIHLGGYYELKRHCLDGTLHLTLGPV